MIARDRRHRASASRNAALCVFGRSTSPAPSSSPCLTTSSLSPQSRPLPDLLAPGFLRPDILVHVIYIS